MPDGFPLINLKAWNDDPLAIQAIKEKIDAQIRAAPGELPAKEKP